MKAKEQLTAEQRRICLEQGTELPFSGKLLQQQDMGLYRCLLCEAPLFVSDTKFDAGCGWPSFYQPVSEQAIRYLDDYSLSRHRTEIRCGNCDSNLGHVFDDGPPSTGLRFCVKSISMIFEKLENGEKIEG